MPYFVVVTGLISGSSAAPSFAVARGHIEHRDLRLRERFAEERDDPRAHGVGEFIEPEMLIAAGDFLEEELRLDDAEIVGAEGAHADDAEVRRRASSPGSRCPICCR